MQERLKLNNRQIPRKKQENKKGEQSRIQREQSRKKNIKIK